LAKALPWVSKGLTAISVGQGVYEIYKAPEGEKVKTAVHQGGSILGGVAGGALASAAAGALAGSVVPGLGTAIGFVVGIGGSLLGGYLGGEAADVAYEALTTDSPTQEQLENQLTEEEKQQLIEQYFGDDFINTPEPVIQESQISSQLGQTDPLGLGQFQNGFLSDKPLSFLGQTSQTDPLGLGQFQTPDTLLLGQQQNIHLSPGITQNTFLGVR